MKLGLPPGPPLPFLSPANSLHFAPDLTPSGDRIPTILFPKNFFLTSVFFKKSATDKNGCETTDNCWCFTKMTLSGSRGNEMCIQSHTEIP